MRGRVLSHHSQVKAETVRGQVTDKKISFLFKALIDSKSTYRDKSPRIHLFHPLLISYTYPSPFLPLIHDDRIAHVGISEVRIGQEKSSAADSILFKSPFQRI